MGNILEYVKWRGDLSFDERPLNEVDFLVLTMISYFDLKNLAQTTDDASFITVRDASILYMEKFEKQGRKSSLELIMPSQLL